MGQCILGGEEFVRWVKEDLLNNEADKERPQLIHLTKLQKQRKYNRSNRKRDRQTIRGNKNRAGNVASNDNGFVV